MKRQYRQNCALAYGLDMIGERWTLLIVRELLIGPCRYNEMLDNLVGIGTNLLASRLREMQAQGLVRKRDNTYELTDLGRQLEPVVASIVRFALALGKPDTPDWLTRPEWDVVALRAVYDKERGSALDGRYVLELNRQPFTVDSGTRSVSIRHEDSTDPVARVSLSKATARRLAASKLALSDAIERGAVGIEGSRREARRLLAAFGIA